MHKNLHPRNLAILLFTATLLVGSWYITKQDPCEDAHMLYRVAENAKTAEIGYNVGEKSEIATEYLWMRILSYSPIPIPEAARILSYAFCVALILMLWWHQKQAWILALTPMLIWVHSGLGTPLFAFLLVWFYLEKRPIVVLVGFLAFMTRYEVLPLLLILAYYKKMKREEVAVLLGLCALFWVGRMYYFGTFIPATWQAKGAFSLHSDGVQASLLWVLATLPLLLSTDLWYLKRNELLIVVLFPLLYLLSDQQMNIGLRFQFAYFPLLLAIVPKNDLRARTDKIRWAAIALVLILTFHNKLSDWRNFYDDRVFVGKNLSQTKGTMLVTEAGWLPYYSKWRAIDALGICTPEVSRNIGDTTALYALYDRESPDLIMYHSYNGTVPVVNQAIKRTPLSYVYQSMFRNMSGDYLKQVQGLYQYCITRGYRLAMVTNSVTDGRWYWVKAPMILPYLYNMDYPQLRLL